MITVLNYGLLVGRRDTGLIKGNYKYVFNISMGSLLFYLVRDGL